MMFTGTTQQQDTRFSDKEKKMMKQMKFGDCLNKRVDMSKVKLDVLRPWISKKITDILHIEDDVVVEFVFNQLEEEKFPCPKKMQINMTGFLNGRNARQFMGELWTLLLSAQESETGIPAEFIQQKKEEILKREDEQIKQELRYHDRSRSRDRERDNNRDRDRRVSGRERSTEKLTQKEREQLLPASTLSAIEQVRSQLSVKSRSASVEEPPVPSAGVAAAKIAADMVNAGVAAANAAAANRAKSPNLKAAAAEAAAARLRNRSPRKPISRDRSQQRAPSRQRNSSPSKRRNGSRDRSGRRPTSRSPRRRSRSGERDRRSRSGERDRRRRRTRSRERGMARFQQGGDRDRQKSRSASPRKRSGDSRSRARRSADRKTFSKSPIRQKATPERAISRKRGSSAKLALNGHEIEARKKEIPVGGVNRGRHISTSASGSADSRSSVQKTNTKHTKRSHSRSLGKNSRHSSATSQSSRAISAELKKRSQHSVSRDTSLSLSPERQKDDFEIRKNKNSVQVKRHYRNNRDTSDSSMERNLGSGGRGGSAGRGGGGGDRRQPKIWRRENTQQQRRFSPRGRSPWNEGGGGNGRNQRSRSRRRSRSHNRSRSPMRWSRSPRRFNRRRSPLQPQIFRGGRGAGTNRGRNNNNNNSNTNNNNNNNWRRSPSRSRGVGGSGGGNRFDRRPSPQRRFSRERRVSPIQNQYRKFSPARRFSPHPSQRGGRDQRQNSRDRRYTSPQRVPSRERIGGPLNRWDQPTKMAPRQPSASHQQRVVSSESSSGNNGDVRPTSGLRNSVGQSGSLGKNNGRRYRSRSEDPQPTDPQPSLARERPRNQREHSAAAMKTAKTSSHERNDSCRSEDHDVQAKRGEATQLATVRKLRQDRYSSSLSRTPSPFLKAHERGQAPNVAKEVVVTAKKTAVVKKPATSQKQSRRKESDSSSDSSANSQETQEEDDEKRTTAPKKAVSSRKLTKSRARSSSSDGTDKVNDDEPLTRRPNNGRGAKPDRKLPQKEETPAPKRRERASSRESNNKSGNYAGSEVSSTSAAQKRGRSARHKSQNSSDASGPPEKEKPITRKIALHKPVTLEMAPKKRQHSLDSDDASELAKKKRKKTKRIARQSSDVDSSSESEAVDHPSRRKKHKKHKKHSKKSKKHKKHKKKGRKAAESNSSSDKDDDDDNAISGSGGTMQTISRKLSKSTAPLTISGINEDLERQLRERALKSMKKLD